MQIQIERDGTRDERPVYRQIADALRAEIAAGRLRQGDRLPAIRSLARSLGVNRDTVALAYDALAQAGALEASVGRGTFVCGPDDGAEAQAAPFEAPLARPVRRLLEFERSRPRYAGGSEAIPLHALVPEPALYPAEEFRRVLGRVLADGGPELLLYGGAQGHAGLRQVLSQRLGAQGIRVAPDEVVLCQGASQGIALALRLFAEPGDAVAVEEPTYHNALAALHGLGLRPVPVPMGAQGPDLSLLERVLARPEVKLLYTIPTFHNPLGITTPLTHRRALLTVARRTGKPVVEDAYEADLRFRGRPVPPLAALDSSGRLVHLVSFSKSLFPGGRVGALAARGRVREALLALRHASDLGGALPLQAALAEFVASGAYDRHLTRLRRVLRSRCDAMLEALEQELPPGVRFTRPEGGYQVWVELPEGMDSRDVFADAARAGVLIAPGDPFQHDGRASHGLRLTYAQADEPAIRRGVAILAGVLRERLAAGMRPAVGAEIHV